MGKTEARLADVDDDDKHKNNSFFLFRSSSSLSLLLFTSLLLVFLSSKSSFLLYFDLGVFTSHPISQLAVGRTIDLTLVKLSKFTQRLRCCWLLLLLPSSLLLLRSTLYGGACPLVVGFEKTKKRSIKKIKPFVEKKT